MESFMQNLKVFHFFGLFLVLCIMALVTACNEEKTPPQPDFTSSSMQNIADLGGNWGFESQVFVNSLDTSQVDTVAPGDTILAVPDSVFIDGTNYLLFNIVGDQNFNISGNKYTLEVNSALLFTRPDTSFMFAQQITETGIIDVFNEKMIFVPDSARGGRFGGSLLTGPLTFAIIDYQFGNNRFVIEGFINFYEPFLGPARIFTTYRKL